MWQSSACKAQNSIKVAQNSDMVFHLKAARGRLTQLSQRSTSQCGALLQEAYIILGNAVKTETTVLAIGKLSKTL